ncbi:MAG: EVE domain-containing protein [Acidobacteria bacterium]|nr:EVE domain-containing protein [Acidobacteriota bacterium]
MQYFLAKTDPLTYSITNFEAEGKTVWDGVTNPQAVQAIRGMRAGDRVFVYHSGGQSAIVGLALVASHPRDDQRNPKSAVVELEFIRCLEPPTTLVAIKTSGLFADWSLVRNSRLSTMPAPPEFVAWMKKRYPKAKI